MPDAATVIPIAQVSQYLCANDAAKGALFGKRLDPRLSLMIYTERKSVQFVYDLDSTDETLVSTANYLYSLLRFNAAASAVINGGGSAVTPGGTVGLIKSPIRITSANFVSATEWEGANSDGLTIAASYTLQVFWNDLQRFLEEGSEWTRTADGVEILMAGFDSTTNDYVLYIYVSL